MRLTCSNKIFIFLQRERNNVAHTAFTVVAMKEYVDTFSGRDTAATNVVGTDNINLRLTVNSDGF